MKINRLSLLTGAHIPHQNGGVMGSKRFVYLRQIYLRAAAKTLCFELQQSHELDYENGTHFAMKFTQDIWQIRTLQGNGVTNYGKKFLHKKIGKTKSYTNKHRKL